MKAFQRSLLLCAVSLGACGGGEQLPVQSSLSIVPAERTYTMVEYRDAEGRCLFDANRFVDLPVVLALRDAGGAPLGGVDVDVYVDFADNTFGPFAPLALYEDRNGNGVVDADTELVSGEGDEIARVRMDAVQGNRALLLRANLSCAYRSELFAYVGGVTARASIEVSAREVVGPPPIDEPAQAASRRIDAFGASDGWARR